MTEILVEFVAIVVLVTFRVLFKVETLPVRAKNRIYTRAVWKSKGIADDRFLGAVEKRGFIRYL